MDQPRCSCSALTSGSVLGLGIRAESSPCKCSAVGRGAAWDFGSATKTLFLGMRQMTDVGQAGMIGTRVATSPQALPMSQQCLDIVQCLNIVQCRQDVMG